MTQRIAAFRAIAVAGGLLASLLLVEILLRVSNVWIGRHSDTMFTVMEHDATLGWKMKPGLVTTIDMVDVEGIPVRGNSAGFWDREFQAQKDPDRCRIAFLGDSFTWGLGVREEERFTNRIDASTASWESLNFGMPGYGTDQSLLVWQNVASRYRPDLVVLTIYHNDYLDNMTAVRYGRRKPYFELKEGGRLEPRNVPVDSMDFWNDGIYNQAAPPYAALFPEPTLRRSRIVYWFVKHSDVARLLYTLSQPRKLFAEARQEAQVSVEKPLNPQERTAVDLMGAVVNELAGRVHSAGVRLLVVLAGKPVPQYELQKKGFRDAGIAYLDATTDALAKNLSGDKEQVYYRYSGHWTPAAHRAVAKMVAEKIREERLCEDGGIEN